MRRMQHWNVVSSRLWSMSLRWKIRFPSCVDLKERYEVFHGVKITDNALVSCGSSYPTVILRTDFLPDKAIDLVDEACALIKTELDSMPTELDELRRKVMQMEIEEAALKKEDDSLSQGTSCQPAEGTGRTER